MKYDFHPQAFEEFEAAADFYRDRQPGLELRFLDAVRSVIHQICATPDRWRQFDGGVRRALVHVFPYVVLYSIEPERI